MSMDLYAIEPGISRRRDRRLRRQHNPTTPTSAVAAAAAVAGGIREIYLEGLRLRW